MSASGFLRRLPKGQVFSYQYDFYKRLTSVSVAGTVLRTYVYDGNPDDPSYSQYTAGRLAEIKYPAINYNNSSGSAASTTFTDMFSYTPAGQISGNACASHRGCSCIGSSAVDWLLR
jgi:hypothetical protein